MSLTPTQLRRYSRQTLLSEIGVVGQERLCMATVAVNADADPFAARITTDYLDRAGVQVSAGAINAACVAPASVVDRFAPSGLRHAAAAFAGAFAAVETIKALVGAGTPAVVPVTFRLIVEES